MVKKKADMTEDEKFREYGACDWFDLCGGPAEFCNHTLCGKCRDFFYRWGNGRTVSTPEEYMRKNTKRLTMLGAIVGKQEVGAARKVLSTKTFKLAYMPGQIKGPRAKPERGLIKKPNRRKGRR